MTLVKILRPFMVLLFFATIGLLVFYLTALVTGVSWKPAWEKHGVSGVLLWAYERGSMLTIVVLFGLAFACAWMPFNRFLAAVSLALFYPAYAIVEMIMGTYSGNLLPFEFLGYLLFVLICMLGYAAGRWVLKRVRPPELH